MSMNLVKNMILVSTIASFISGGSAMVFGNLTKRQAESRVCPTENICGEGTCLVTTHPSYQYQYVCKCKDLTMRFDPCPAANTNVISSASLKCSAKPCGSFVCIEASTSPTGYICQCGQNDFRTDNCQVNCSPTPCKNGGVCTPSGCICSSGYSGLYCEKLTTTDLCNNINCKNGGICTVQSSIASCVCPSGFGGYYCELRNAANRCYQTYCLNGGTCEETLSMNGTPFAFCMCKAGYTGTRCETEYFRCNQNGNYVDIFGCDMSRYLECSNLGNTLMRRDCPPGLRFNTKFGYCDIPLNVVC